MRQTAPTRLLTTSDVGRRIARTSDRVRQLARLGRLVAAVVTPSGQRLYDTAEVDRYLAEREAARQ